MSDPTASPHPTASTPSTFRDSRPASSPTCPPSRPCHARCWGRTAVSLGANRLRHRCWHQAGRTPKTGLPCYSLRNPASAWHSLVRSPEVSQAWTPWSCWCRGSSGQQHGYHRWMLGMHLTNLWQSVGNATRSPSAGRNGVKVRARAQWDRLPLYERGDGWSGSQGLYMCYVYVTIYGCLSLERTWLSAYAGLLAASNAVIQWNSTYW